MIIKTIIKKNIAFLLLNKIQRTGDSMLGTQTLLSGSALLPCAGM